MRQRTIQQIYQKKSPIEHILLRPDTYVGSIEMERSSKWVRYEEDIKLTYHQINFVPALYKIFDQVLVNAADNYQRDRRMNLLKVEINPTDGVISVTNNGKGIPVTIHKEHKIYVPELIFGHLLTGSNYDDGEKKVVGGRNGYGAKLANIFSTKFIVQCLDGTHHKKFKMVWQDNMSRHSEAEIQSYSGKDYTTVTYHPDLKRFGMQILNKDIVALLSKRVYDMAGLLHRVKVFLNGRQISTPSFNRYVDLYFQPNTTLPRIHDPELDSQRWEVVVSTSDGQFKQVSFVNSICTTRGGTHVNYITEQLVDRIQEKLKKKDKNLSVKPFQIKAHLWIFVNCLIENPTFDSQTKETLTLKASQFGSSCKLSEKVIKEILKSGVVDDVFNEAKAKQLNKLAKMTGGQKKSSIIGVPKLEDANHAGSRSSQNCTLILTEGDSAKSLAMAGLQIIGRDYYGVFPLKGKLLNVRQACNKIIMNNVQIQNLIKILGLQINKKYDDLKSLRYGSIMIMADQDTDGSHIKGLVINFIHTFWPTLFKIDGFLKQFITPLLKVTKAKQVISFYTMQDYKIWSQSIPNLKQWKIKYYKGLGTSTDKEAQEYFEDLVKHKIDFDYGGELDDQAMQLIFSKHNADKRKNWLHNYDVNVTMVYDRPSIHYEQFVNKQFIHFSYQDNMRSIASVLDGFKPGQRKIIYACFKRNLKQQIKVAQLSGYVAQHSAYHHGEMSLTQTIVNMAQNFVGSNNINLLMPNGQFGSRNNGGKDHASARYIFTNLSKITRVVFPQADDHTLKYVEDDGQYVEPEFYMPIIPMSLVNGCQGIGTGWSTFIPNFNPRQIVKMIQDKIKNQSQFTQLIPYYKGFSGQMVKKEDAENSYEIKGMIEIDMDHSTVHIKQLSIGKWTKDYKIFLDELMQQDSQNFLGLREHHTKNRVHFELEMNDEYLSKYQNNLKYWQKILKISGSMSLRNMVGFNAQKLLKKYQSTKSIMEQFYELRLEYYVKRKQYLISKIIRDVQILTMKEKFIIAIVEEQIIIRNVKKIKLYEVLKKQGYIKFSQFTTIKSTKNHSKSKEEVHSEEEQVEEKDTITDYNYLLNLPLLSLTYEKVEEIKRQKQEKQILLQELEKKSIQTMWNEDLQEFLRLLDEIQEEEQEQRKKGQNKIKGGKNKRVMKKKNVKDRTSLYKNKKNKKNDLWDSDSDCKQTQQTQILKKHLKAPKDNPKKEKKVIKSKKQVKIEKQEKPQQSQQLLERVKRKMMMLSKQKSPMHTVTRPINDFKTLQNIFDEPQQYQIVQMQGLRSKKKMSLDSDQQIQSVSQEQWQQEK